MVTGGLLQALEEQLRRRLAPIEERVRSGDETRGAADGPGPVGRRKAGTGWAGTGPGLPDDRPVIVLPHKRVDGPVGAGPGVPDEDRP